MNPLRRIRRLVAALAGLAGALLAFTAAAPAALAMLMPSPPAPGLLQHPPVLPPPAPGTLQPPPTQPAQVVTPVLGLNRAGYPPISYARTVVIGGMPGWQIALIAVAAALFAATIAVVADLGWSSGRLCSTLANDWPMSAS